MYDLNLSVPNISTAKYSNDEKFQLIKNYLYELNDTLSVALSNVDLNNFSTSIKNEIQVISETHSELTKIKKEELEKFNKLKNQIITTADKIFEEYTSAIEKSEEEILLNVRGEYVANSEFGEYKNEVESSITENSNSINLNSTNLEAVTSDFENFKKENKSELSVTADAIISQVENIFASKSELQEFQENISSQVTQTSKNITESYKTELSALGDDISTLGGSVNELIYSLDAYIKRGELEEGVFGIEIGRSDSNIKARFTNDKLSFYQGATEVAYISKNNLYILRAEITDYLKIGNSTVGYFIFDTTENGLEVRWSNGS